MIPIIQKSVVEDRKWLSEIELLDIIAISETTPGPISTNAATYVGYKVAGIFGAIVSTLAICLPSFVIIYIISLFYEKFMTWTIVANAFKGLKIGVIILLVLAVFKLKKNVKFKLIDYIVWGVFFLLATATSVFSLPIPSSSIIFIAFGLLLGIVIELITKQFKEEKDK